MAARLVVLVKVVLEPLPWSSTGIYFAAISVSPETNTKPKKMKLYIWKKEKIPEQLRGALINR